MLKKIENFNSPGTVEASDEARTSRFRRPPRTRPNLQELWESILVESKIIVKWESNQYTALVEAKNPRKQMLSVVFNDGSVSDMPLGSVLEVLHTPEREPSHRQKKKPRTDTLQHNLSSSSSSCSESALLSSTICPCKLEGIVKVKVEQKAEEDQLRLVKKSKRCERVKSAQTLKWEKTRRLYQTDKSGTARFCFRRGCHKQCITTVLGGSGIEPSAVPSASHYPFIEAGEVYIAGRNDFNPWDAAFPGDHGLVDADFFHGMPPDQKEFHYFRQCERSPWKRGYHGRRAAGTYLYLGKYQIDEETPEQTLKYKDLPSSTQDAYVEYKWKKKTFGLCEEYFHLAQQVYDLVEGAGAFVALPEKKKETLSYHAILCEINQGVTLRGVKFVSYDEALYERLVEISAIAKNGTAQVESDDAELGPLY